ncbi:NPCBM/NEW2 domain-containing protein [Streptomyces sp. NPDC048156]|uniref:NPCBM/NEW2 domain-containing protein n=1 Tax=Streptomyces sp. NPDC048156 TaxID=3365502 RepID=UPI0037136760
MRRRPAIAPLLHRLAPLLPAVLLVGAAIPASAAPLEPRASPPSARSAGASRILADAPPMGWNNWNAFGCDVSADLVKQTADLIVEKGLFDRGYEYVNIDDCWADKSRDADGKLVADTVKFPEGIGTVADYVHARGLKLGLYADAGTATCAGYPGSLGHERTDAATFAAWGVDLLKYDNCHNEGRPAEPRYQAMSEALAASGRDILFSICEWGSSRPWTWAPSMAPTWRIDGDINNTWHSVRSIARQTMRIGNGWVGPGFNDPDMLQIGNGGLSPTEERTHFALWSLYGAPLILGNDLRSISDDSLDVVSNKEVIDVDRQFAGHPVREISARFGKYVLARGMDDGSAVVALYNETDTPAAIRTTAAAAGLPAAAAYHIRDLERHRTRTSTGELAAQVPAHGAVLLRLSPAASARDGVADPTVVLRAPTADGAQEFLAGSGLDVTAEITAPNGRPALRDLSVALRVPKNWKTGDPTTDRLTRLSAGKRRTWTWTLRPGRHADRQPLAATVSWKNPDGTAGHRTVGIELVPTPAVPKGTTGVADLPWLHAWAGYASPERNSGIEGQTLQVAGASYAQGVGSHSESEVAVWLGGRCSKLTTWVGVQDGTNTGGSVIGQVLGDGKVIGESEHKEIGDGAQQLVVDVTGVDYLELHTTVGDDSSYGDRIVWGDARLDCQGA